MHMVSQNYGHAIGALGCIKGNVALMFLGVMLWQSSAKHGLYQRRLMWRTNELS